MTLAAFLCCFAAQRADALGDYELGRGYDVGPFNFAGYSELVANLPDHGARSLVLDDLSLFVTGHLGRFFNPFVEAELSRFDILRSGSSDEGRHGGDLVVERLYNDAYLTDSLTLRLGKMLTPVGEWNEIHAAPLVLTTIRPAVTQRNFSKYASGVSILYSDPYERFPDMQVYWQPTDELSKSSSTGIADRYKTVEGAHVAFPIELLDKVGLSFQQSKDSLGIDQTLYGLDFHFTFGKLTLQGEATFSDIGNPGAVHARDEEWGAYGAASYALSDTWSVHGWYESYADRTQTSIAKDVLAGAAYRPRPGMVFKMEYLQNIGGHEVNPTGLFASWSVLF